MSGLPEFCKSQKIEENHWHSSSSDENCSESDSELREGRKRMLLQAGEHLNDQISPPEGASRYKNNKRNEKKRCRYENLLEQGAKMRGRGSRNLIPKQPLPRESQISPQQNIATKIRSNTFETQCIKLDRFAQNGDDRLTGPTSSHISSNPLHCTIHGKHDHCAAEKNENGCLLSTADNMSQRRKERESLKRQKEMKRLRVRLVQDNTGRTTSCHNSITIPGTFETTNEGTNQPQQKSDIEVEHRMTSHSQKSRDFSIGDELRMEESWNQNKTILHNGYSNERDGNCLAERGGEGIKQLSSSNCLQVLGNKNNLEQTLTPKVMKRRDSWSSSSEDDASNSEEEEDPPEIENENFFFKISKKSGTTFSQSKADDIWVYCHERGCSFWTRKPERMARHAKCHVPDNKHYQCPDCPLRFYSLAKMLKHDRKVHTGVKDYECRVCDAEVTDIQIHMRVSFHFWFF
jgi:hypothetical protein